MQRERQGLATQAEQWIQPEGAQQGLHAASSQQAPKSSGRKGACQTVRRWSEVQQGRAQTVWRHADQCHEESANACTCGREGDAQTCGRAAEAKAWAESESPCGRCRFQRCQTRCRTGWAESKAQRGAPQEQTECIGRCQAHRRAEWQKGAGHPWTQCGRWRFHRCQALGQA